jgi:hypothetical protein
MVVSRYTSPTNWVVADGSMVSRGHRVELVDGRVGVIDGVSVRGRPMVALEDDSGQRLEMHPTDIACRRPR